MSTRIQPLRSVGGEEGGLGAMLHAELLEDVSQMFAGGVVGNAEENRTLGAGFALPDNRESLGLAIAEAPAQLKTTLPCRESLAALDQYRGVLADEAIGAPDWVPRSFAR